MSLVLETNSRPAILAVTEVCDVNGVDAAIEEPPGIDNKPSSPARPEPDVIMHQDSPSEESIQPDVEMTDLTVLEMPVVQPDVIAVVVPMVTNADVRRLQSELLLEESRLILMRKLFQLQNQPPKVEKKEEPNPVEKKAVLQGKTAMSVNGPVHQNGLKNAKGLMMGKGADKINLKDPKMQSIMKGGTASNHPRSNIGPAVLELSKSLAHRQSVMTKTQQRDNQSTGQNVNSRAHQTSHHAKQQQPPQQHPMELLEQQLSAEKLALKRQMEKAISQISPPKAPAPDMNFIPATVCPDFIALLGMELAASYAITSKNLVDQSPYPEPFVCLSCQENVCPAWKLDAETGAVVCESCFTASRTNAARLSHIENLKVAFADVVEKEAELDRRHAATLIKAKASHLVENIAPALPVFTPSQKAIVQKNHMASVNTYHNNNNNNNNQNNNNNNRNVHHNTSRPSKQQPQQHPSSSHAPHRPSLPPAPSARHSSKPTISTNPYQQMGAPLPFAPTSSMSKHSAYHGSAITSRQTAERQYLLDMISRPQKQQQQQQPAGNAWRK